VLQLKILEKILIESFVTGQMGFLDSRSDLRNRLSDLRSCTN